VSGGAFAGAASPIGHGCEAASGKVVFTATGLKKMPS